MTTLRTYVRANRARALTAAVAVVVIAVCVVQAFVAAYLAGGFGVREAVASVLVGLITTLFVIAAATGGAS